MAGRRIAAVSSDEAVGEQLVAALQPEADVEYHRTFDAIDRSRGPRLFVIHVAGELERSTPVFLQRLTDDSRVILVVPSANLGAVVDLMYASERIVGVLAADRVLPRRLVELVVHASSATPSVDVWVLPDTQIQTLRAGDANERRQALELVARAAETAGLSRDGRATVEQCCDELIMNALYDAPVDADGKPLFAGVDVKTRLLLRTEQTVEVAFACDGTRFVVAVRDAFGSLERGTVLRVLYKCLHADQKIDRRAGGAGVGLYLLVNTASMVAFRIVPGVMTEVVCALDIERDANELQQLAFVVDPAVPHGTRRKGRRRRAQRSLVPYAVAVALAIASVGAWAWIHAHRPPPPPATVEIDSLPPGASLSIDGSAAGETPVTLATLRPGADVSLHFHRTGYTDATMNLHVPAPGEHGHVLQPLAVSPDFVRVHITSVPPGARVIGLDDSDANRTYTPASVFVAAGQPHELVLAMPGRVPVRIGPFTPARGAGTIDETAELVPGATLHVAAAHGGTLTIDGAPLCRDVTVPADCTLAPGTYTVKLVGPDRAVSTRTIAVGSDDQSLAM